jgi:ADP-L-glycero-D-manno-heptose 6-epimerase
MIAITGAAGFIGSNLAHRLAAGGHELILVDHPLTARKAANWVGLSGFRFLDHSRFLEALSSDVTRLDAVFHLGACSSTTETNWSYLVRNNIEYSQVLWKWCSAHDCPFLYASSAATYGDGSRGFSDRTPPTELQPLNLYGKSKNDFDIWALAEQRTPPKWAGLKFFNVFGPREIHKGRMASVVYQAWRQVRDVGHVQLFRSTLPEFSDGGQKRDFVAVEDCVSHLLWLWRNPASGGLYNSGTGAARTFLDLARAVFAALAREPDIRFIDMPLDLAGRYQSFTEADMSKLRGAEFSEPATALEDGVRQTVEWLEGRRKDSACSI